jgi:hypothetical protein
MSKWLLIIVMFIYLGVAISYYIEGNKGMALVFFAYALANVGFII